jgi:tripartite-type tricarboxylate transporter receptor subunit TctC
MLSKRLFQFAIATAGVCLLGSGAAADQPYPNRPVRIIVAGVPGTPFDLIARAVAGKLTTSLKQTFVVETRPGAAGNLGAEFVAKAAADGYTLLIALGTTFTVNPSLYKKLPYDPERDLRPITITAKASTMLVVHPSVPVYSVPEFVALAKQEPVSYAHGGHGSPGHLSMEYFRLQAGFGTVPVPYRGNAPLVTDLVAGQIKFGFVGTAGVVQHVVAGRLRALAISAGQRSTLAPDVPTMSEAGYPNFKVETYYVISAPAGTPESIVGLLEHEIRQALKSSDLQETFRPQDIEILATTGAEAKARLKSDAELWAKVVNAAGMHVD